MSQTAPVPVAASGAVPDYNDRATFGARVLAWDLWTRDTMVPGVNAAMENVYTNAVDAYASALGASTSAATAQAASAYKGEWSTLTGALNMPASVSYGGFFCALNANLANVATATPGVAAQWTQIVTQDSALVVVSTTTVTAATGQTLALANVAATAVTLPAFQPGLIVWVVPCNKLSTNTVLRNGANIGGIADDIMLTDPRRTYAFLAIDSFEGWRPM